MKNNFMLATVYLDKDFTIVGFKEKSGEICKVNKHYIKRLVSDKIEAQYKFDVLDDNFEMVNFYKKLDKPSITICLPNEVKNYNKENLLKNLDEDFQAQLPELIFGALTYLNDNYHYNTAATKWY